MLIVKKFGGSSVADKERIYNVANRIIEDYRDGNQIVVVLSAMGKTTDKLISQAKEINPNPSKRELDMLMVTGEQVSVALMSMALSALGVPSVSLNAFQVPMKTSSAYGNARLRSIGTERMKAELESGKIVLVTGFQGINRMDDFTTLGRGGSDTTAVALAAELNADICEIFTDVDGVFTADPRVVPDARKIPEITYNEMLEMAALGAKVLHHRSVELAKRYGVKLIVRSSLDRGTGTIVKENVAMTEGMMVSGVAADKNVAIISIMGVKDEPGIAFKIFRCLGAKNISIDIILQAAGEAGKENITFSVARTDLQDALAILEENKDSFPNDEVRYDDHVAKISAVGAGLESHANAAVKLFEALYNANINIHMIGTSEIRLTVFINEDDADRALRLAHEAYELGQ